jgi:hypothetical protein
MKTRKELAELLKFGIEDGDTDTVWFAVGELEKDDEVIEKVHHMRVNMERALEDARKDAPLGDDEYYESNDYYQGAIDTLYKVIQLLEGREGKDE